jgi:pimeloyl-ACP methyl ester carboxylesterase
MFSDMGAVTRAGREVGSGAAVDAWMNAPFFAQTIRDPEAGEFFRYVASGQSFLTSGIENPRVSLDPPATDRLGELEAPMLVIAAEYGMPSDLEVADLLERMVDGARRITMAGTGHLTHIERPDEFNAIVLDFLDSPAAR